LNIDGCRVGTEDKLVAGGPLGANSGDERTGKALGMFQHGTKNTFEQNAFGRWPANLIHDGSDEVVGLFPTTTSGAMKSGTQRAAQDQPGSVCYGTFGGNATTKPIEASSGSAARFFYCAKASRADRNEGLQSGDKPAVGTGATMRDREDADWEARNGNYHPTVKPTDLMRYLCRLVTPPGGVVLDPFMGSGSTGKAAKFEGFEFVGCEMSPEYFEIARARIEAASKEPVQDSLF
jgi:site-specific DNA-methyltransferase (adenine-specific)